LLITNIFDARWAYPFSNYLSGYQNNLLCCLNSAALFKSLPLRTLAGFEPTTFLFGGKSTLRHMLEI